MKKQILLTFVITIVITITANAQTVALHSSTGVQLFKGATALTNAYTAALNGDTLYLSGGSFTSTNFIFDKSIKIFGAGHYPDSTQVTGKTFINGNLTLQENADLFYLEGVEVTGTLQFTNNHSVNNVIIKRCKINGTINVAGTLSNPSSNLSLIGNVFNLVDLANAQNALISNNIFSHILINTNGNIISNNIFLRYYFNSVPYTIRGDNNILNNNIFVYPSAYIEGTGNTFNYNLFVNTTPSYGTSPTTNGNYTGVPQANLFVNQTGTTFDYSHNYHLQSPTTYVGNDSKQVGIYGGTFPYKEGAVPLNPHFQAVTIAPTTNANGELQIQIKVGAQND